MFNAILNNGSTQSPLIAVDQSIGDFHWLEFYTEDPETGCLPIIVWDGSTMAKFFYSIVKPSVEGYTLNVNGILHFKSDEEDKPYFAAPFSITKFVAVKETEISASNLDDPFDEETEL